MTKNEYFTAGREDHHDGKKPRYLKPGTWQHEAYMSGWDSYIPSKLVAPATLGKTKAIITRRSLEARAHHRALKHARHATNPFWVRRPAPRAFR